MAVVRPAEERFREKYVVDVTGCWLWQANINKYGYGTFINAGKTYHAHRFSWMLANKPELKDGLILDHLCRVKHCVNPDHLEQVTNAENVARGWEHRARGGAAACKNGHPMTMENTYWGNSGSHLSRTCRICSIERGKARYQLRKFMRAESAHDGKSGK